MVAAKVYISSLTSNNIQNQLALTRSHTLQKIIMIIITKKPKKKNRKGTSAPTGADPMYFGQRGGEVKLTSAARCQGVEHGSILSGRNHERTPLVVDGHHAHLPQPPRHTGLLSIGSVPTLAKRRACVRRGTHTEAVVRVL